MLVTLLGIVMLVRLVQEKNAPPSDSGDAVGNRHGRQAGAPGKCLILDGGETATEHQVRQAHTKYPMLVTLLGIVMLVRLVHAANAASPILVMPLPRVRLVRLAQ